MQLVGQSAALDWECTWGRPLKMKFREDGMELWLPMVISINLANSFLAQAGRPQTPERHWLTFRFLNSYPFLPPSWNAVPFVQMFFLILLSNTTEQLVTSVTAQLSFLGHFSEDSSGFPEYWIHWYGIDSNLSRGFHHFVWLLLLFHAKVYKTDTFFFALLPVLLIFITMNLQCISTQK